MWAGEKVPVGGVRGGAGEDISHMAHCVRMIWLLNKHLKGLFHISYF